jgi:hypothetical protein
MRRPVIAVTSACALTTLPPIAAHTAPRKNLPSPRAISAENLFKRLSPAVVKITLYQHGIPVGIGAGFFVSSDGVLVTNHHVMRSFIGKAGFSAEFQMHDKKIIKDFKVAGCGDERLIDLCILKLNVKSKSHFSFSKDSPSPGKAVYVIGHPRGLDFSISNGIVSAIRKSRLGVKEVQISAAMSAGNSGGPIFDERGRLIGVATKYIEGSQNLNFGIMSNEVESYLRTHSRFLSPVLAKNQIAESLRSQMKKLAATHVAPILKMALQSKSLSSQKSFREVSFDFGERSAKMYLLRDFEACERGQQQDQALFACFALGESVVFALQRYPLKERGALLKLNGQMILEPRPHTKLERIRQEDDFDLQWQAMTLDQTSSFSSNPKPAQCQQLPAILISGSVFTKSSACRFRVLDDTEPGGESVNLWAESGAYLYSFSIWVNDPALLEYYGQIPAIALLTARWGESAPLKSMGIRAVASKEPPQGSFNQPARKETRIRADTGRKK